MVWGHIKQVSKSRSMHNKHTDISVNFFGRTSIVQFISVLIFKDDPKLFIKRILLPAFDKVAYFILSSLLVILSLGVYPENSMGKKMILAR